MSEIEPEVYESPDIPIVSSSSSITTETTSAGKSSTTGGSTSSKATKNDITNPSNTAVSPTYKVDDIVNHTINAKDSFEVFMGRYYDPNERYLSPLLTTDTLLSNQDILYPSNPNFDKLANYLSTTLEQGLSTRSNNTNMPNKRLETPLLKYNRLLQEVSILQKELQLIQEQDNKIKSDKNGSKTNTTNNNNPTITPIDHSTGIFRLLTTGTTALDTHLQSIKSTVQQLPTNLAIYSMDNSENIAIPKTSIDSIKALQNDMHTLRETQALLLNTAQTINTKLLSMEQNLSRILQDIPSSK